MTMPEYYMSKEEQEVMDEALRAYVKVVCDPVSLQTRLERYEKALRDICGDINIGAGEINHCELKNGEAYRKVDMAALIRGAKALSDAEVRG